MIKRISAFALAAGKDPEALWKSWYAHAQALKKAPHLKRYHISRVVKTLTNHDGTPSDDDYYGIIEMWFDNEEGFEKAEEEMHALVKEMGAADTMGTFISSPKFTAQVVETIIK
jgi:hypothetical protein